MKDERQIFDKIYASLRTLPNCKNEHFQIYVDATISIYYLLVFKQTRRSFFVPKYQRKDSI